MATYIRSVDGKVVVEIEPESPATLLPNISDQGLQAQIDALRTEIRTYRGQPVVVNDSSDMDNELTIYLYVGSEEGYNADHWYYYDGTEWVDGGEYVANPVLIDDTLTQSGEAADAKVTGDEISAIKADLTESVYLYNSIDLIPQYKKTDATASGIAYAWSGNTCTITGTATGSGSAHNIQRWQDAPPKWIVPGKKLYVKYSATKAKLNIRFYNNGTTISGQDFYILEDTEVTIPSNMTSVMIRFWVTSGDTVNESVEPIILTALSNADLSDAINSAVEKIGDDIDSINDAVSSLDTIVTMLDNNTILPLAMTQAIATNDYGNLMANLPTNTYAWTTFNYFTDCPNALSVNGAGYIFTLSNPRDREAATTVGTQICIFANSANTVFKMFYRRVSSGAWSAWSSVYDTDYIPRNIVTAIGSFKTQTVNGITFTWNTDATQCAVAGTASGTGYHNFYSDLMAFPRELQKGETYYVSYETSDYNVIFQIIEKDSQGNKNYVNFISGGIYTVPSDVSSIGIRLVVYTGNTVNATVKNISIFKLSENNKKIKIAFFGDSIINGSMGIPEGSSTAVFSRIKIPNLVEEINQVKCDNFATGGIGYPPTTSYPSLKDWASQQDLTGYTHVFCLAGDNGAYNYPLGAYTDTGDTTHMGYVYQFVNEIKTNYPDVKLVLFGKNNNKKRGEFPRWRNGVDYYYPSEPYSIDDFNAELKKLCAYYSIGYVDIDSIGFDSYMMANNVSFDDTHLTEAGYVILGSCIADAIKQFIN